MTARDQLSTVLVIDNYDSFAYNLVQYVGEIADEVLVRRNDAVDVGDVQRLDPTGIVVSPGPGTPAEAGVSIPLFEETSIPILGVCLGHQALCAANGAPVVTAPTVVHGKPSVINHDGAGIFESLPERFQVGRYHSLAVERDALPDSLTETASTVDDRNVLMAVRHDVEPHIGVQFHPESILTRESASAEAADIRSETDTAGPMPSRTTEFGRRQHSGNGERISLALGKQLIRNFCTFADEYDGDRS